MTTENRKQTWNDAKHASIILGMIVIIVAGLFWVFGTAAKAETGYTQSIQNKIVITEHCTDIELIKAQGETYKKYFESLEKLTDIVAKLDKTVAVLNSKIGDCNE